MTQASSSVRSVERARCARPLRRAVGVVAVAVGAVAVGACGGSSTATTTTTAVPVTGTVSPPPSGVTTTTSGGGTGGGARALANFAVEGLGAGGIYNFSQSTLSPSTLSGTAAVPVSLQTASPSDPTQEWVLSGRLQTGSQRTSQDLVLAIRVEVDGSVLSETSDDGSCSVNTPVVEANLVIGSFECTFDVAGTPVRAAGSFEGSAG